MFAEFRIFLSSAFLKLSGLDSSPKSCISKGGIKVGYPSSQPAFPAIALIIVVFPDAFGPNMIFILPASNSNFLPRRFLTRCGLI
jgi:hypothetical protein